MFTRRFAILAGSALAFATTTAGAQGRRSEIPPGQMPPAGLCQVWIDGVPPGRQPRPTDCATARRHAPANSHVIYGNQSQGRVSLDPRMGTANGRYDPRYGTNENYGNYGNTGNQGNNGRYGNNGNYGNNDSRYNDRDEGKFERKREKEREKAERRNDKRWNKENRHDGDDRSRDDR